MEKRTHAMLRFQSDFKELLLNHSACNLLSKQVLKLDKFSNQEQFVLELIDNGSNG